jgi:hypothetical protein
MNLDIAISLAILIKGAKPSTALLVEGIPGILKQLAHFKFYIVKIKTNSFQTYLTLYIVKVKELNKFSIVRLMLFNYELPNFAKYRPMAAYTHYIYLVP